MFKKILIIFISLIILFFAYVVMQPSQIQVERSVVISSSDVEVYSYINNHLKWEEWSPWANLDDNAEKFYGGPLQGVGSYFKWSGNNSIGAGTSTIIENKPNEYVRFRVDFTKPTKTTSISEFKITKIEMNKTRVQWNTYSEKSFIAKIFGVFIDCNEIAGNQIEKGLINLKNLLELRK